MNDQERKWLDNASRYGGSFVQHFAFACFQADDSNFSMLRPILDSMMQKYPAYSVERTVNA